ncbi:MULTISPECIES: hypothetical protein [unclassified Polaribacter]|uniref:hypothetical protein n=1 Tax=unclassified Polaribacter TaxID=196858 RepID=UPI0011BEAC89|nr:MULTISPECIES: hypothetical protein [unclassified Polaribacter]TXD52188.1 hypothetical protein ES043_08880 [Polaribacter sp. IC063]TXD60098.1 hypothetical protein ES044_08420 [Polaribacter sp. IC066]
MHKKIESDLIGLAHSILEMKNKENVFLLKEKSKEIYEKLSVLAFVEEYVNSTVNLKETKSELLEKVEKAYQIKEEIKEVKAEETVSENDTIVDEKVVYNLEDALEFVEKKVEVASTPEKVQPKADEVIEQPFAELEEIMFSEDKVEEDVPLDIVQIEQRKTTSLEEELQDTFSVDLMADLFENVQPKSLNDKLAGNIQIGLNDRIVFVKNLFGGSQEDFNRVVSQLNTFKSYKEAKDFIDQMVKPDYDWSTKEELETRFMGIIERKFA